MKKQPQKNNTFCYYPFHELTLKFWNGHKLQKTSPCCMMFNTYNEGMPISNMNTKTPDELFNSSAMRQLRKDALQGVRNPACEVCWSLEDAGQTSFRMFSDPVSDEVIANPNLDTLDITLSHVCNLRCRMCDVSSSNRLNIDFDTLEEQGTRNEFTKITGAMSSKYDKLSANQSRQFKWLYKNTDKIKTLKASGGEPFYDKNLIRLLQQYIENGTASSTDLHFHTNATMIDDRVINIIKYFKRNNHTFSIDGTDRVYEYIRHEANWDILNNNIKKYVALDNVAQLNLNMVVTAHNLHNVLDYVKWSKTLGKEVIIVFSDVYPKKRGIQISNLPRYLLEPVYNEFKAIDLPDIQKSTLIELLEIAIETPYDDYGELKLYRETVILDQARNQSYKDYLYPEMVEYLNGVEQIYLTQNKK